MLAKNITAIVHESTCHRDRLKAGTLYQRNGGLPHRSSLMQCGRATPDRQNVSRAV
jgi:hypothetical protein